MNCPHCHEPIDPLLILKARQTEIAERPRGKHPRPGAVGMVRNGCAHNGVWSPAGEGIDLCMDCGRPVRWDAKADRWRIRYAPKQKSPSK
jgi:hypothetical protein